MRQCWFDSIIGPRLNPLGKTNKEKVHPTTTIHITLTQYRKLHRYRGQALEAYMDVEDKGISSILAFGGITSIGSCFFRDPLQSLPADPDRHFFEHCWSLIEADQDLQMLNNLRLFNAIADLPADIIEMLYLVRNAAVHGDLDFLDTSNNGVARSGLFLLNEIIAEIVK